jgi:cellulose biosynthesis protein BcsQ
MGTIVTFYSYKGGTGRTLALANVGALLAQWGHKVLCVDWDLEAPGLHLYFDKLAPAPRGGLVEVVAALAAGKRPPWRRFVSKTKIGAPSGRLDLLAAGKLDRTYVARLQALDWNQLYDEGLAEGLEQLRAEWTEAYDFVLLDSRTGITDIGGICTAQLPDILVLMLTANDQSLDGIVDVAERARAARRKLPLDKPVLQCLPVPSRFDQKMESAISQKWLQKFAARLEPFYRPWLHASITPSEILAHVKIPYIPIWSFGERLPVLEEGTADPETIGFALETLAALIAHRLAHTDVLVRNRDSFLAAARGARAEKDAARGEYGVDAFLSYAAADADLAARLSRALKKRGLVATPRDKTGAAPPERERALRGAKHLVALVGPEFGGWQLEETMSFLKMANMPSQRVVVLLTRDAREEDVPPLLREHPLLSEVPFGALTERLAGILSSRARDDDPQFGLWGRQPDRNKRVITARVRSMEGDSDADWFRIDLTVQPTRGAPPLRGLVRFHLHPSIKRHVRAVDAMGGTARLSILAYGAFTVGAEADGGRTVLELDLATVPRAPRGFVEG